MKLGFLIQRRWEVKDKDKIVKEIFFLIRIKDMLKVKDNSKNY